MKTKESYFYADGEPVETGGLRTIAIVITAACMLLSFFAWISFPIVTTILQATSSITGLSSAAEYSIPEFAISIAQLTSMVNGYLVELDAGVMAAIAVAIILIVAIWAVPLVLAVIGLVRVIGNKAKPAYLLRSFKWMVGSSLFFIVIVYALNLAGNLFVTSYGQELVKMLANDYLGETLASLPFVSSFGEGFASLLVTDYICTTIWVWLVLVLAILGIVLLKSNRAGALAGGAVEKIQGKIKSAKSSSNDESN